MRHRTKRWAIGFVLILRDTVYYIIDGVRR